MNQFLLNDYEISFIKSFKTYTSDFWERIYFNDGSGKLEIIKQVLL